MTIVPRTGPFSASSRLVQDVLVPAGEVVGTGGEDRHGAEGSAMRREGSHADIPQI